MQLPNLSRWRTDQGPPQVTSTPVLQSLEDFRFDGEGALPWLQFLASDGRGTRERLKFLDLPGDSVIDSVFLSSAVNLRNLIKLQVRGTPCSRAKGCSFRLTDDNVKDLATSLPRLECLYLGYPCGLNTCKTTVASLMSISIHCPDLSEPEIHFNVKTIVDDMQGLIDEDVVHNKAKCQLRSIYVGGMRLQLDSAGLRTVATGFGVIFPHMENLEGYHPQWPAPSYEIEMRWTGGYAVEAEPDP